MWHNIPQELKELPQWLVWREEVKNGKPTKVPYRADGLGKADVTDYTTWTSYDNAVATAIAWGCGIGFVLTQWDPYCGIDIDDHPERPPSESDRLAQYAIYNAFASYSERSPSGRGVHIIIRGTFEGPGRDQRSVGVYCKERYLTFTGDVVNPVGIEDRQELLNQLVSEMPSTSIVELEQVDGVATDDEVHDMAMRASNGDKYNKLCRGEWQDDYPSHSEADFALLSILAFYTRDNEQVLRLFSYSKLYRPDSKGRNYLPNNLRKIRAKEPVPIDPAQFQMPEVVPQPTVTYEIVEPTPPAPAPLPDCAIPLPPGLVGEVAAYLYSAAVRPVPEIALAGAMALIAGICGRAYNVSGTGLNQYIILLATTGTGKEAISNGLDKLINAVRPTVPMADQFLGPAAFASGQALIKVLDDRPCFVSVLGEFGVTLQQLCDQRASGPEKMLRKVLLDLYNKSGWHNTLKSSAYSDSDKNTKIVRAPNVTILGESTPSSFFDGLSVSHIAEGLIPRFSVVRYKGKRMPRNRNAMHEPDPALVKRLCDLIVASLTTSGNNQVVTVTITPDALALTDAYDREVDGIINASGAEITKQVYNRAHLKALKVGALLAVGINQYHPVITADLAEWAINFTRMDVAAMIEPFESGEIGSGDHRQELDIRKAVEDYLAMDVNQREQYKTPTKVLDKQLVPFGYLRRRLRLLASFKDDRRGAVLALEMALKDLCHAEILALVPPQDALSTFNCRAPLYYCGPAW